MTFYVYSSLIAGGIVLAGVTFVVGVVVGMFGGFVLSKFVEEMRTWRDY
jgi:hypothetical protein